MVFSALQIDETGQAGPNTGLILKSITPKSGRPNFGS
jgi:hypothetical protein